MKRRIQTLSAALIVAVSAVLMSPQAALAEEEIACAYDMDNRKFACAETEAAAIADVGAQSHYKLARLYTKTQYDGSYITVTGSTCTSTTSDKEHFDRALTSSLFNNNISSVYTDLDVNTKCSVKLYKGYDFVGHLLTVHYYAPDLRDFGADERTSSYIVT